MMALSDTCFDALDRLQNDLVEYAEWGYNPTELSRVITAMYELGEFMVRQDIPPSSTVNIEEILDGVVVANILDKAHKENCENICEILAQVAKVNSKLSKSIDAMFEALSSKERLLDVLKDPRLFEQITKIKKIKND
jgi:hypothetical protein